jgi:type IV secretory pathway component VirB8
MEINGKWEEYPVQWDEETFFLRRKANEYALKKSKEWLSENTGIKEKRIFTEAEWFEHKASLAFAWIITILFVVVAVAAVFMSNTTY